MIGRLGSASVWAAGVVPTDDPWRNAKRIWLPLFDVIMITSGINAIVFGSRLLDRLVTVGWLKQLFEAIITAVRAFFGSKK